MSEGDASSDRPRVFISYAQYEPAHSARVLELAYALEADGLALELDPFYGQALVDWPRWCAERLDPANTDFVLMVRSAEYRRRIEGRSIVTWVEASFGKATSSTASSRSSKGRPLPQQPCPAPPGH